MLLVTVSSSAVTMEDFDASISSFSLLSRLPEVDLSILLLFGQFKPQLIARRRLDSLAVGFVDLGEEDTINWASAGFASPRGLSELSGTFSEYRSHNSSVGSACGDLRAWASFLTLTEGVFGFSGIGDDTGDELLARFLPLRDNMGDNAFRYKLSCLLSHSSRSFGDVFSSSAPLAGSSRSFHVNRVAGVVIVSSLVRLVASCSFSAFSMPDSPAFGWYWNLLSLFFVTSDTGWSGRGRGAWCTGLLLERCHGERYNY